MGFPRFSSAILAKARAEWGHPNAVGTLSTWHFQMSTSSPPADEYGGLDRWLRAGHNHRHHGGDPGRDPNPGGAPTVEWKHTMSAVPGGFEWLASHGGTVGGLPVLDFPEYSMFGCCPWGGYS